MENVIEMTNNVASVEDSIFNLEQVRVVIRAPLSTRTNLTYAYEKMAPATMKVKDWLNTRVTPLLPEGVTVEVIDPSVFTPNINILTMGQLRDRYIVN